MSEAKEKPETGSQEAEDNKDVYVNQKSIAYLFGISARNFAEWNVAPVGSKGRETFYSVKQTIAYAREKWQTKKSALTSKREKLLKLQADKLELEVLEKQGSLFPREVVEIVWSEQITHFRLKVLSVPSKLCRSLSVLKDTEKIKKKLKEALQETLEELSKYNYEDYQRSHTDSLEGIKSNSKKVKRDPKTARI